MSQEIFALIELFNAWFGGAATTMIGALVGRLMWHTNEVRKMRRKFFGKELFWEIPIAVGMAFIGAALASWLALEQPMASGLIALAYLGPRGSEVLFMRWFAAKLDRQD
ncbi:phage holin family protein [Sinorhizobium medicae]